jgi:hypothetical protein
MALAQLCADEHAQGVVLGEVVTGYHGMAEQRRDAEHEDGKRGQDTDGASTVTSELDRGYRNLARAELLRAAHEQRHNIELSI